MASVNINTIMPRLLQNNKSLIQKLMKEEQQQLLNRPPKIFISHKTKDKGFAKAIIDLLEAIGVRPQQIFCSSIPGYGVEYKYDFIDVIKEQYLKHKTYIIIIHSKDYYRSSMCMNKLGAAWIINNKMASFLTQDCKFSDLEGVIKPSINAFKAGNKDTFHLLDEFISDIQTFFKLNPILQEKINILKYEFIDSVTS